MMMFGFFDSDLKRVRKLRLEFEDVRQRVLYKMNPYQQFSFLSAYHNVANQIQQVLDSTHEDDLTRWRQNGEELKDLAKRSWRDASRMSGIGGEGATAGAESFALHSIRCSAKGYRLAEALTIETDLKTFLAQIEKLVADQQARSI